MKKLNITKEAFEKSQYFKNKYGELEYVSESGKIFKTSKGKLLKFNEGAYHDKTHLNIRDYDKLPDEEKDNYVEPMFGIGMVVNLSDEFYKYADMYGREEPKTGWRIKDVEYTKIRKIWEYYIVNDDSPYHADKGFWAEEDEICDEYDESTKKFGRKFKESDEWDDAIFKPSNELQKLYKQLKAKYGKGDIEIRLADMDFGKFWLVVEVPEDDVKTLDKMEKILKSKCEGNENWEVFREEHLYGDVSTVAIQENPPKKDKDDKKRPVSEPKPPFMGIKGTQDHGSFIMYRNAAIEKDELFQGIQAMLDDEGIDASAEDWASDPKNKREVRDFLKDYAHFANDY